MPRGVRGTGKAADYEAQIQKIDDQIASLQAKREEVLSKKRESDIKKLTEFMEQNNMSVEEAIALLSPAKAASAQSEPSEV